MIVDFFFFFLISGVASSSEADEEEGRGNLSLSFAFALAAAFLGSTYLTLTRILWRREEGEGRVVHSGLGIGTRRPFQTDFMISTIISCCEAPAWTSRLTITGRSLSLFSSHLPPLPSDLVPVHERRVSYSYTDVSKRHLLRQSVSM